MSSGDAFREQKVREADEASKAIQQEAESATSVPDPNINQTPHAPISIDQTDVHIGAETAQTFMTWEDMLQENHFHDTVNDDEEMY